MQQPSAKLVEYSKELRRHIENALWALREAKRELDEGSYRQAYNKVFVAWKELIAITLLYTLLKLDEDTRRQLLVKLQKTPYTPIENGKVHVTTSNAAKLLKLLLNECEKLRCPSETLQALKTLEEMRKTVYMLHTAYYEGAEHAGFIDDREASLEANRAINAIAALIEKYSTMIGRH